MISNLLESADSACWEFALGLKFEISNGAVNLKKKSEIANVLLCRTFIVHWSILKTFQKFWRHLLQFAWLFHKWLRSFWIKYFRFQKFRNSISRLVQMDEFKKFRTNGKMEDIVAELNTFKWIFKTFQKFWRQLLQFASLLHKGLRYFWIQYFRFQKFRISISRLVRMNTFKKFRKNGKMEDIVVDLKTFG